MGTDNNKKTISASLLKGVKPQTKNKGITCLIAILFFGICTLLSSMGVLGSLFSGLLIPMCVYVIMAISLNLTVGILGELSLGHAGFMCVGAYISAIFSILTKDTITSTPIRFGLALLVGGLAAAIVGILIGIPILRLQGDYLAIVTLAFGEVIRNLMQNVYISRDINGLHFSFISAIDPSTLDAATNVDILKGPMAMNGIPQDSNIIIASVLVLVTIIVTLNIIDSRTGRAIMAVRDNRLAAEAVGISVTKYKLIVFATSAFFAGIAGVLFGHFSTVYPAKFDFNLSILILVFVVLGGIGSVRGSIIATLILYALPELLRGLQNYRMLVYSVILIGMMLLNNNEKFNTWKQDMKQKIKKIFSKKKEVA